MVPTTDLPTPESPRNAVVTAWRWLRYRLGRPSLPIPLAFVLVAGCGVGLVTAFAMLSGHDRSLLLALTAVDLVFFVLACVVAAWLIRETRRPMRRTVEVVHALAASRFAGHAAPTMGDPDAQAVVDAVWQVGSSTTHEERRLATELWTWQRKYSETRGLIDLVSELNRALGLQAVIERLTAGVSRFFAGDGVAVWTRQREGPDFGIRTHVAGDFAPVLPHTLPWVQAVLAGNAVPVRADGIRTELAAPLFDARGTVMGILMLASTKRTGYTPQETAFLQTVIGHAALAIQNAVSYDNTDALTRIDPLTGLFNRREFDRILHDELQRAARYLRMVSLVMLDIDHFKKINDQRGHPAGDFTLQKTAELMRVARMRGSDTAFRVGGEEFAILLPETDKAGAIAMAERLRQTTEAEKFFDDGQKVTISIGVATYPDDATTPAELVSTADQALYDAKHSGRNQVKAA